MKLTSATTAPIGLADIGAGEVARVEPLATDHARIGRKPRVELAMADIDGVDPGRAPLEQHLGKSAGRGADIERDAAARIVAEMIERGDQLQARRARRSGAPGHRSSIVGGGVTRSAGFVAALPSTRTCPRRIASRAFARGRDQAALHQPSCRGEDRGPPAGLRLEAADRRTKRCVEIDQARADASRR